jgi:PAS domain S-box-containing protein
MVLNVSVIFSEERNEHLEMGTSIVDRTIRWFTPLFILLPVFLIIRAIYFGGMLSSSVQSLLLVFMWVTGFMSGRIPAFYRMSLYIACLLSIGTIGMIHWGLFSTTLIPVVIAIILSSMMGFKRFLMVIVIIMALVSGVAVHWVINRPPMTFNPVTMSHSPFIWLLLVLSLISVGGISLVWEGIYQKMQATFAQLVESELKYRDILNSTSEALFIHDDTGRILDVNEATCVLFEIEYKNVFHYSVNDLSLGESPYSEIEAREKLQAATQKGPQVFEWQSRTASGNVFWSEVALRASTIKGQPRIIASVRDISERKKAELEKAKLESSLRQAQKMEAVGRLAGGVAHDFNNMLGVILGNVEMAMELADPLIMESLEEIRTAAERSASLTRQLLVFARKQTIAPKILDLNQTVDGMLKILTRLIGEHIDLRWLPGQDLWPVKIDPTQVDQILTNLCVNARDAMGTTGKLTIETRNVTLDDSYCETRMGFHPGRYVLLAVSDNGCGMDKHTLDNLFEPFFTTKGAMHGSGLGLATLYGIVKQNNGFINVYSELGMGTTFKIYLSKSDSGVTEKIPEKVESIGCHGSETILLVEDELSIMTMTAKMLEKNGYTVLTSSSPVKAIRIARAHNDDIHLLVTDVVMPEMNGRDLACNLKPLYPEMKILYMSGYTANVIAHHGILDEGINFIQKPFSKKDITLRVREVLDLPYQGPRPK